MCLGEARTVAAGFGVDDEVGVALAIERHVLGAVLADGAEAHLLEEFAQGRSIGRGVFDELEAVGADRDCPRGSARSGSWFGFREKQDSFI